MNAHEQVQKLKGDLLKALERGERIEKYYREFCTKRTMLKDHDYDLVILAEIFVDYYTSLETAFVRVAKFFENSLDTAKWHSDLLERMIIDIPEIRPRMFSDQAYSLLLEFMRFRHFRRYYFQFDYDRDKMDFLEKKFLQVLVLVKSALNDYIEQIDKLSAK
ncbi:MAG: hypothetical protein GF344_04710 [Chitinivibrionales bacterium]|nr:hypothetical protein [Chitinivibrionales bacterium]